MTEDADYNSETKTFTIPELETYILDVLHRLGLSGLHAETVAATILAGERDGDGSHGLYRLKMVAQTIWQGSVDLQAIPVLKNLSQAVLRVEGKRCFAPLAFHSALPSLIERAKTCGVAVLAINDCVHFAALWPEVEAIAQQGLVGIACTASHAWVAPYGGMKPLFGTNPLAFGWPRPGKDPFVFDFATSAASRGDIELHRQAGQPLPDGWGIDSSGQPTNDPQAVLQGAMLPFGGHKGSAIALMVELLAGPLIGDMTSANSMAHDGPKGSAPTGGELILAIDPACFQPGRPAGAFSEAETLFAAIVGQGARLPSLRRYAARRRAKSQGIDVPVALLADIEIFLKKGRTC